MTKLYVNLLYSCDFKESLLVFGTYPSFIIIGNDDDLSDFLKQNSYKIDKFYLDKEYNNPLFNYDDISKYKARIEKGAIIRKNVTLADSCVILMGAVINIGAKIGENTMIDMNAVIGSGAIIANNVHISAGVVISGVLEPISTTPVVIEDNVFIGANSVVKEGVHIHKGAIIGANSFVTHDVTEASLYYGTPAKYIRPASKLDYENLALNKTLRSSIKKD